MWFFVTNTQKVTTDTKKTQFFCDSILLKIDKKLPLENLEKTLFWLKFYARYTKSHKVTAPTGTPTGTRKSALSLLPPCPRHGGRHAFEAIFPSFFCTPCRVIRVGDASLSFRSSIVSYRLSSRTLVR